jgi:hypothetical protein
MGILIGAKPDKESGKTFAPGFGIPTGISEFAFMIESTKLGRL